MLILSRRHGEAIVIGGGIRIIVLSSDRRGARLGIEAPSTVNIRREELPAAGAGDSAGAPPARAASDWLERPLEEPPP
jgi:carbon storage regulator